MSDFMKDNVLKNGIAKSGEMMTISKRAYQNKIGNAYRIGEIDALLKIGKTSSEIAEILELHESTVRSIINKKEKFCVGL